VAPGLDFKEKYAVFRSCSGRSAFARTATAFAFVAALISLSIVSARAKPGDKTWTINLGPADHESMDGNPWNVEVFDAVSCKSAGTFAVTKSGSKQVQVAAREGAGSALNKGEFGGHFRWPTQGPGATRRKKDEVVVRRRRQADPGPRWTVHNRNLSCERTRLCSHNLWRLR
jgi:hypothetical protein